MTDNDTNLYNKEKENKNNQNNVNLITQPISRKPTAHNASLTITLPNPTLPTQVQKRYDTTHDNLTTLITNTSNLVTIKTPDALLNESPRIVTTQIADRWPMSTQMMNNLEQTPQTSTPSKRQIPC